MVLGLWNQQWLGQNSQRAYPLTEWASKEDETGAIRLPDSFLVGLYLPIHAGLDVEPSKFFLRALLITPTGYNVAIGYDDETADPPLVASVNIAKSTHTENRTYALSGADDFADSIGQICIGRLDEIDELPPGQYYFAAAAGQIEPDCIRPLIRGISSIVLVNGSDRSVPLYGDIELVAGANMRITPVLSEGSNPQIVFSAIEGEGLNEECVCEDDELGPCIRTINGIGPLPDGNFRFVGNDCVDISPITNGLEFSDTCSKPCCGCPELEAIKTQLDRFGDGYVTLQNFVNNVSVQTTTMQLVVLGSKLSDQGCLEC